MISKPAIPQRFPDSLESSAIRLALARQPADKICGEGRGAAECRLT